MKNKFRHPTSTKRRIYTIPVSNDWNTLINYWGRVYPYNGYEPVPDPSEPMPSEIFNQMISEARTYLGYPYTWGGKNPPYFDCSGFVGYLYKKYGIIPDSIISYTGTLHDYCNLVANGDEYAGDLCFWNGSNGSTWEPNAHVGIYVGNGYILDCSSGGVNYRLISYHPTSRFAGFFRPPTEFYMEG